MEWIRVGFLNVPLFIIFLSHLLLLLLLRCFLFVYFFFAVCRDFLTILFLLGKLILLDKGLVKCIIALTIKLLNRIIIRFSLATLPLNLLSLSVVVPDLLNNLSCIIDLAFVNIHIVVAYSAICHTVLA